MKSNWNISKLDGHNIIYNILHKELIKSDKILINDIIDILNKNTKNINLLKNNKVKSIESYIKDIYGSLISYIDNIDNIGILYNNNNTYAILINKYTEDWIFV